MGRFLTADPYRASAGAGDPGSWNRTAYVQGDPANRRDPEGLKWQSECDLSAEGTSECVVYEFYEPMQGGKGDAKKDPKKDEYKPRQKMDVFCQPDVIEAMKKAWGQSSAGRSGVEAGFRLDGKSDTEFNVHPTPFTNQVMQQSMQITGLTFAIFHVHPNGSQPEPSPGDRSIGGSKNSESGGIMMYTMSQQGLYVYNPETKETSKVRDGLDWTKPCDPVEVGIE